MPAVAALLDSRAALVTLRRTLASAPPSVVACRSVAGLRRAYEAHLLDGIVVGRKRLDDLELDRLRRQFPQIPVVIYGPFRPDDGALLLRLKERDRVAAVAVEGVDDAVVGDLVQRHLLSRTRQSALADAPKLLRLTEPLQREAWAALLSVAGRPVRTEELAAVLGVSREHLSRQFAAGGAPNLKRVIDFLRIVCAAQLLANPGYDLRIVAELLEFGTPSHLHAMSRRIAGVPAGRLAPMGPRGVLLAFTRSGTRSRG
jgi:AraC-like DNA-binding protein